MTKEGGEDRWRTGHRKGGILVIAHCVKIKDDK